MSEGRSVGRVTRLLVTFAAICLHCAAEIFIAAAADAPQQAPRGFPRFVNLRDSAASPFTTTGDPLICEAGREWLMEQLRAQDDFPFLYGSASSPSGPTDDGPAGGSSSGSSSAGEGAGALSELAADVLLRGYHVTIANVVGGDGDETLDIVLTRPSHDVRPCPGSVYCPADESAGKDCVYGEWSEWQGCVADCGGVGTERRDRRVVIPPWRGGRSCEELYGPSLEERECTNTACQHCAWEWQVVQPCDAACQADGVELRQQLITQHAEGEGAEECEEVPDQAFPCTNDDPCHCEWGEWDAWSACQASCQSSGERSRQRAVTQEGVGVGAQLCDSADGTETEGCFNDVACGLDCEWGAWSEWSECSVGCEETGGTQQRSRGFAQEVTDGGQPCVGEPSESQPCDGGQCPDCAPGCETPEWLSDNVCDTQCYNEACE